MQPVWDRILRINSGGEKKIKILAVAGFLLILFVLCCLYVCFMWAYYTNCRSACKIN